MTLKAKVLGAALLAAMALGALSASAASAADKFTVEGANTANVTGTSEVGVLKITTNPAVELSCATAKFSGTITNEATEATVLPTYSGTKADHTAKHCESSFGAVTFDMNECDYDLTGNTTQSDEGKTDAVVSITCPTGKQIVRTNELCNIKIPAQTPTEGGATYTNVANGDVTVKVTMTGLTYTTEGAFCALGGLPSHGQNADYTDDVVLAGFEDLGFSGDTATEGNPLNISVSGS